MFSLPSYSAHDVALHNECDNLWVIIDDRIFDLTNYMHEHPGGKKGSTPIHTVSFERHLRGSHG